MATVLVTGANKGIGLEIVRVLSTRGDSVIACCRRPDSADELKSIGGDVEIVPLDVASDESVAALAESLSGRPIDVLINNAGAMGPKPDKQTALEMDFDGWADTLNVNVLGPVRVMQALIENLRAARSAKVMTVSSQMGALSVDMPFAYAYCSSKAAINKFMKMAAAELQKESIAVGVVHPGWVRTDMGGPKADLSPEESAAGVVRVTDNLTTGNAGGFWRWDGERHDW